LFVFGEICVFFTKITKKGLQNLKIFHENVLQNYAKHVIILKMARKSFEFFMLTKAKFTKKRRK